MTERNGGELAPDRASRIDALQEGLLRRYVQSALDRTMAISNLEHTAIEQRLRNTADYLLHLTQRARTFYEETRDQPTLPTLGLHPSQEELLRRYELIRSRRRPKSCPQDAVDEAIASQDPIRLVEQLDISNEADCKYDFAAQMLLSNIDRVEMVEDERYKRYERYMMVVDLKHPTADLQLAVTRRHITPESHNPIPLELGGDISHPVGVHYSIAFRPVTR